MNLACFEQRLGQIEECIRRYAPAPVVVAGDFNAKSRLWRSPRTDTKGETLEDWAASLDLLCLNTGSESTFVGRRGESIVDLIWAFSSVAARVNSWRLLTP